MAPGALRQQRLTLPAMISESFGGAQPTGHGQTPRVLQPEAARSCPALPHIPFLGPSPSPHAASDHNCGKIRISPEKSAFWITTPTQSCHHRDGLASTAQHGIAGTSPGRNCFPQPPPDSWSQENLDSSEPCWVQHEGAPIWYHSRATEPAQAGKNPFSSSLEMPVGSWKPGLVCARCVLKSWNGWGGKGHLESSSASPAVTGTSPTLPGCSKPRESVWGKRNSIPQKS